MWLLVLLMLSIFLVVLATGLLNLHPFLVLLVASFGYGILCGTLSLEQVSEAVSGGFGGTMANIGIIILEGSLIGAFLEFSGGARRIAEKVLHFIGKKQVPLAMNLAGFITSIPVFCDSGFLILSPLGHELSRRAGVAAIKSSIALSLGLYATHTLVPPTPGPTGAAGIIGADLGLVVILGLIVSLPASLAGWAFTLLLPNPVMTKAEKTLLTADIESDRPTTYPSLGLSLAPIFIPILLMVLRSYAILPHHPLGENHLSTLIGFLGQPIPALFIGLCFAIKLPSQKSWHHLSTDGLVGVAIKSAGPIIIITCAGGSFGKVLQASGIGNILSGSSLISDWGIWFPFLTAAALKIAQGSSTVAMITTAGIITPILEPLGFSTDIAKALAVVAIGAGSMITSHANDSYFWIVTQVSKMNVRQGYLYQSVGTILQGFTAGLIVWVLYVLLT